MQISIKNLGIVQTAEIELNGITVIAGHNDIGKSFIGKLIFSIVHTIQEAPGWYEESKSLQFEHTLQRIYISIQRVFPIRDIHTIKSNPLITEIGEYFRRNRFNDSDKLYSLLKDLAREIDDDLTKFDPKQSRIRPDNLNEIKEDIDTQLDLLFLLTKDKKDNEELYRNYFDLVIINEVFNGAINTLSKDDSLEVTIIEGSTVLLSLIVEKHRVKSFNLKADLYKDNSIMVETPTVISINRFYSSPEIPEVFLKRFPLLYRDLLDKMITEKYDSPPYFFPEIVKTINDTIKGEVEFDNLSRRFLYINRFNQTFVEENMASGIKSFGVLEMLLKKAQLTPDTILIIDEPEVHLHPEWEILYVEILFALAKSGITILLATHSGYFAQAISEYSERFEMEDKVKFYYGDKNEKNVSTFKDVTSDLEPIFAALSKPMRDIFKK